MRRLLSRRRQLVKQSTRAKNEISAVLLRTLQGRPPVSDVFGKAGRAWLAALELGLDERETVDAGLRQLDFLQAELAHVDQAIAEQALGSVEIRRLMTIPGVDVTTAATLMAAIGDVSRFPSPRHLPGYLGLDPKLRQSGVAKPRHGRISKEGSAAARHALVEAARSTAKAPGPLRAFAERTAARRGRHIAAVAVARKLAVLAWHLLSRGEDYAYQRTLRRSAQAPPTRAQDRCPAGEASGRGSPALGQPRPGRPRARARPAGRARLPPTRRRLAADTAQRRCGCDTGARIFSAV